MTRRKIARMFRSIAYRLDPPDPVISPRFRSSPSTFDDLDFEFGKLYDRCINFTMTGVERLYALYASINYIVAAGIPGAIVECGVWRGGSSMMSALRLKELDETSRRLYLYDTYAGMSEPTEIDVNVEGKSALPEWGFQAETDKNLWDYAPFEEVQHNMRSTEYPEECIQFIKGKVEDTIPGDNLPESIGLLRLDTDWYESTYHELVHLYPRLAPGGVVIIDDYGHWQGARKAVDQYLEENHLALYLHRIDYTGRLAIKPGR